VIDTGETATALATSRALHARVQAFIAAHERGEASESFDLLACDIARFQMTRVAPVARLAKARKLEPAALTRADEIPGVPTDVFKLARLAAHAPALDERVFRTSGTTQGREQRGEHPVRDTSTYSLGAAAHGRAMLWPDHDRTTVRVLVLGPRPERAPDSSLTFMCDLFGRLFSTGARFYLEHETIDRAALARDVASVETPVLLLGTSFAFVHLLDDLGGGRLPLPPGSRVMQTGGFKGKSRVVEATELLASMAAAFAIDPGGIASEYGMTELSSQCYEGSIRAALGNGPALPRGVHVAPPWLRVTAVEPATLEPLPAGEIGLARMVDLANVDSSVTVQTQDRIREVPGGFELLGRAPGAPPRGCSLATEEMLGRGHSE
jgi:hypothetical protein